jgi:hypothetical protein
MKPVRTTFIALTFAMILALVSCGNPKQVFNTASESSTNTETTIEEVQRDTTFKTEAETSTALVQAVVKEDGSVQLNTIATSPSANVAAPTIKPLGNNTFQVDCEKQAEELFASWKEQHKTQAITITETEKVMIPVEKELTFWQKTLLTLGWICVGLIVVSIGIIAFKIYKIFK